MASEFGNTSGEGTPKGTEERGDILDRTYREIPQTSERRQGSTEENTGRTYFTAVRASCFATTMRLFIIVKLVFVKMKREYT